MSNIHDVIIIGGGPAGYTAALYCARAGLDTLVIEKMSVGGQMALTGEIENYPGIDEGVDGFSLGMKMQASAEKFGAKTHYASVNALCLTETPKKVITDEGEMLTKCVIIATGAYPRVLGLEAEDELTGRGVHYCAHCDGRFYRGKTVAVVGGGNSAVEDALYLSRLAKKVILIHRRDSLRADKIYRDAILRASNVEFLYNSAVISYIYDSKLTGVRVKDLSSDTESELSVDGLFVSVGRVPSSELVQGVLETDGQGYIIADETTRTSIDGVFAAGDVRTKTLRQIVTAVADGALAAHYAQEYIDSANNS
jgi:thioredoxin reductase (NADPH)